MKVDSKLNFQMALLHITFAFSEGKAVTVPVAYSSASDEALC